MKFTDPDKQLTREEVAAAERELGLTFPSQLRTLFLNHNGADPQPYVFRSDTLHTVVSQTLPLISDKGRGTAIDCYRNLVVDKAITDTKYFPFAVDAGGDYFFVDCSDPEAAVYFYRSDNIQWADDPLEKVADSLSDFWNALQPEEK